MADYKTQVELDFSVSNIGKLVETRKRIDEIKAALKSMREEKPGDTAVIVELEQRLKSLKAVYRDLEKEIRGISTAKRSLSDSMRDVALSAAKTVVGLSLLRDGFRLMLTEAMEAEDVQRRLNVLYGESADRISAASRRIADATGGIFDNEAIAQGFVRTKRMFDEQGLSIEQQIELMEEAAKFARLWGISVEDASTKILQGLAGNERSLRELGVEFDGAKDAGDRFAVMLDALRAVNGKAALQIETTSDKLKRLNATLRESAEFAGGFIADVIGSFADMASRIGYAVGAGDPFANAADIRSRMVEDQERHNRLLDEANSTLEKTAEIYGDMSEASESIVVDWNEQMASAREFSANYEQMAEQRREDERAARELAEFQAEQMARSRFGEFEGDEFYALLEAQQEAADEALSEFNRQSRIEWEHQEELRRRVQDEELKTQERVTAETEQRAATMAAVFQQINAVAAGIAEGDFGPAGTFVGQQIASTDLATGAFGEAAAPVFGQTFSLLGAAASARGDARQDALAGAAGTLIGGGLGMVFGGPMGAAVGAAAGGAVGKVISDVFGGDGAPVHVKNAEEIAAGISETVRGEFPNVLREAVGVLSAQSLGGAATLDFRDEIDIGETFGALGRHTGISGDVFSARREAEARFEDLFQIYTRSMSSSYLAWVRAGDETQQKYEEDIEAARAKAIEEYGRLIGGIVDATGIGIERFAELETALMAGAQASARLENEEELSNAEREELSNTTRIGTEALREMISMMGDLEKQTDQLATRYEQLEAASGEFSESIETQIADIAGNASALRETRLADAWTDLWKTSDGMEAIAKGSKIMAMELESLDDSIDAVTSSLRGQLEAALTGIAEKFGRVTPLVEQLGEAQSRYADIVARSQEAAFGAERLRYSIANQYEEQNPEEMFGSLLGEFSALQGRGASADQLLQLLDEAQGTIGTARSQSLIGKTEALSRLDRIEAMRNEIFAQQAAAEQERIGGIFGDILSSEAVSGTTLQRDIEAGRISSAEDIGLRLAAMQAEQQTLATQLVEAAIQFQTDQLREQAAAQLERLDLIVTAISEANMAEINTQIADLRNAMDTLNGIVVGAVAADGAIKTAVVDDLTGGEVTVSGLE